MKRILIVLLSLNSSLLYAQQMWINEFHYDNASTDLNEFIEVVVENTFAGALSDIEVVFYNGSDGGVYDGANVKSLDTFEVGVTSSNYTIYSKLIASIQNGDPDGIALVNNGNVVYFYSYEGSFTATNGPAIGLTSVDIGVFENFESDANFSLQLSGSGTQYSDFSWQVPAASTKGMLNNNQTLEMVVTNPEIFDIQGNGEISPYDQQAVILENNIVTAVAADGFFIQTPDSRDDLDLDTSNGLYVNLPKNSVSVGDNVTVSGSVQEFFGLTQLTSVTAVVVNSQANSLPSATIFNLNVPSTDPFNPSCSIEYECYENMLIDISNGMTNTGSQSFNFDQIAEVYVTANGQRARRETGIALSESTEVGLPMGLPIFDENPEVFKMDPDALGLPNTAIIGGSAFSATGVLFYTFGAYEFWPKNLSLTNRSFPALKPQFSSEISIVTFNIFRLFDDIDNPLININSENNTTTEEYNARLLQLSEYLRTKLNSPDIILIQEIESLTVLQALANQINTDDPQLNYSAYHEVANTPGLELGILTKNTVDTVTVTQLGADEVLQFGNTSEKLHTRPPLLINANINNLNNLNQEINIITLQVKSHGGIIGANQDVVRNRRFEQSLSVAQMVQNLQINSPLTPLIVAGDFNAYEFTDGYVDVVGEIKGQVNPNDNVLSSNGSSIVNPVLTNSVDTMIDEEKYSVNLFGNTEARDHALFNDAALIKLSHVQYLRGNSDAPAYLREDHSQLLGLSDHDALVIYLDLLDPSDLIFRNRFE